MINSTNISKQNLPIFGSKHFVCQKVWN